MARVALFTELGLLIVFSSYIFAEGLRPVHEVNVFRSLHPSSDGQPRECHFSSTSLVMISGLHFPHPKTRLQPLTRLARQLVQQVLTYRRQHGLRT